MNLFQCAHSLILNLWICHFIHLCMYLPVKASFQPTLTCFRAARRGTCDALHRSNVNWLKSGLEQGRKRQQSSPGMMQKKKKNCVLYVAMTTQFPSGINIVPLIWSEFSAGCICVKHTSCGRRGCSSFTVRLCCCNALVYPLCVSGFLHQCKVFLWGMAEGERETEIRF